MRYGHSLLDAWSKEAVVNIPKWVAYCVATFRYTQKEWIAEDFDAQWPLKYLLHIFVIITARCALESPFTVVDWYSKSGQRLTLIRILYCFAVLMDWYRDSEVIRNLTNCEHAVFLMNHWRNVFIRARDNQVLSQTFSQFHFKDTEGFVKQQGNSWACFCGDLHSEAFNLLGPNFQVVQDEERQRESNRMPAQYSSQSRKRSHSDINQSDSSFCSLGSLYIKFEGINLSDSKPVLEHESLKQSERPHELGTLADLYQYIQDSMPQLESIDEGPEIAQASSLLGTWLKFAALEQEDMDIFLIQNLHKMTINEFRLSFSRMLVENPHDVLAQFAQSDSITLKVLKGHVFGGYLTDRRKWLNLRNEEKGLLSHSLWHLFGSRLVMEWRPVNTSMTDLASYFQWTRVALLGNPATGSDSMTLIRSWPFLGNQFWRYFLVNTESMGQWASMMGPCFGVNQRNKQSFVDAVMKDLISGFLNYFIAMKERDGGDHPKKKGLWGKVVIELNGALHARDFAFASNMQQNVPKRRKLDDSAKPSTSVIGQYGKTHDGSEMLNAILCSTARDEDCNVKVCQILWYLTILIVLYAVLMLII